ncbi:hypothetical protein IGI04_019091, partial [Brassica rapa subsp. trilocularis]
NKLVEDIVGTLAFPPLVCLSTIVITPKLTFLYNHAWQPVPQEEVDSSPVLQKVVRFVLRCP